ncbi:MAG TPA: FHA domain-containing protein [Aggregatilineaceae bacterium]|nr:FHA domain-containing protein [Aggregatilineaceae bacterium]
MTLDVLLLILRAAAGIMLFLFLMALFVMIYRDYRAVSREIDTRTRRRGRLIVASDGGTGLKPGTIYPLLPYTSLGRALSNTIALNDSFASAEHATVTLRGGQWWLEDRGSSNGTVLNGYRIQEPVVLSAGDVIAVGRVEFKLELE